MATLFNKNLLPEFDSVKDDDETILWVGKPKFIPFIFSGVEKGLFIFLFGVAWIVINYSLKDSENSSITFFWLIGLIPVLQSTYYFLKRVLSFSNTVYAYSNKRIMIRTGFIGTDFKIIDYDKISDIEVTVNIIERIYNVGSIRFYSGRTETNDEGTTKLYDSWSAIENPYSAFKSVKQVMVDIKTDYNYPNALRPEINPGYTTRYDRPE